ncbi:MAG: glycosyltransferase [Vicinamibacterales bacterium]
MPLRVEPPLYRRRVDFYTKSRAFDTTRARTELGFAPQVDLEEGIHRTADWCPRGRAPVTRLNIVHICDHLGWEGSRMHGVKRLFAWMLPRFDKARFNALISLRRKDLSEDTLEQFGVDVSYMARHKFDPATYPALLKVLRKKEADVVHMHECGATTFGRLCAWRMGIPPSCTSTPTTATRPGSRRWPTACWPCTRTWPSPCRSPRRSSPSAPASCRRSGRRCVLGAPLDEFARVRTPDEIAAARAALGIAPDTIAVSTITRLMPSKETSSSWPRCRRSSAATRARVFIVGEGELQGALEAQAAALNLGDRLVFCGFQRDVAMALSALDVVAFPSLWEGTPLTVFETLAMGKPIVATDADGLMDVLVGGRDALVVPKRDAARLADAICTLIEQPALAAELSAGARVTGAHYDIQAFVTKMERLYELLHETSRRTGRAGVLQADLSFLATSR